ncbi:RNA polymerase sigma-70 factor [Hymenobacter daeguensis]
MPAPDDAALNERLAQLRQTNPSAFIELLFKTFYAPLGAVAYRVVPDRAVVEDLLQDVFMKVWQGLAELPAIASYRAYLTRMALNAALRYRQRDQRQVAWDEAPPDTAPVAPDALAQLHAAEATDAIAAALGKLPPQCRVVFELSRYEEMSYQQIADALELSPKTVENQMGKALRILRQELAGVLRNLYGLLLYFAAMRLAGLPAAGPAAPVPGQSIWFGESRRGSGPPVYLIKAAPVSRNQ